MKRLTLFFERRPWWLALGALWGFWGLAYMIPNHLDSRSVDKTWSIVNLLVPFVDWTVIIYLSVFVLIGIAIVILAKEERGRTTVAALVLITTHFIIFVLCPTELDRFGLSPGDNWGWLYQLLWMLDKPRNCFPSLHVSVAVLATLILWRRHAVLGPVFFSWALAVAVSTLTTKQHYLADVAVGAVLAGAAYIVVFKIFVRSLPPRA